MASLEDLKKAVVGDAATETIKSGTLVTTRGIGVVAVGLIGVFLLMDQLGDIGPWHGMSDTEKLGFVLGAGAIWALVAAADAVARGLATTATRPTLAAMPSGLVATRIKGVDSPGWHVAAVQIAGMKDGQGVKFLVVKGAEHLWVPAEELSFG